MNSNLIAQLVLGLSLIGIIILIFRKIPVLVELQENFEVPPQKKLYLRLKETIRNLPGIKSFSSDIFLQKVLSKIRILSLKTESKTFHWLQKLRKKSQENKFGEKDNYWEKIKKSTK